MFYVGVVSSFKGKAEAAGSQCLLLEKLGHSQGRAKRFLDTHPPIAVNGIQHRSVVFVLPDNFRLRNDIIQLSIRQYKCNWQTAKFHIYREAAGDVMGNKADWLELFPDEKSTADPVEPVSPGNVDVDPVGHDIVLAAGEPQTPVIEAKDVILQAS